MEAINYACFKPLEVLKRIKGISMIIRGNIVKIFSVV